MKGVGCALSRMPARFQRHLARQLAAGLLTIVVVLVTGKAVDEELGVCALFHGLRGDRGEGREM